MMVSTTTLATLAFCVSSAWARLGARQTSPSTALDETKVPVVLGVMSKCPDALYCESVFDEVLQEVADKVDLSLTFIGKLNDTDEDFGVTCMHGAGECAGNVQELCAMKYAPQDTWWEFVQCLNFQGREKVGNADVALQCAKTAKLDWEESGVGECAGLDGSGKGEEGVKLLKASVQQTEDMGITKSCTIVINDEPVCIHDGTWKNCTIGPAVSDFVDHINTEYDKLNDDENDGLVSPLRVGFQWLWHGVLGL